MLTDFGCSRLLDGNLLADPVAAYPLHQVPERFWTNKLGIEADIYQAGLTLYRLCNGDELFFQPIGGHKSQDAIEDTKIRNKVNEKIKKGKYPDRGNFLPHIPARLRRAIRKALEVNPDDRFHSAADFINDLSDIETNLDWQFSQSEHEFCWTLEWPVSVTRIVLTPGAGVDSANITTTKTNRESGNTQKSTKHCGTRPNSGEGFKWVAEIAEELGQA